MTPLVALFIGYAVVWVGLCLYLVRLHRLGRALQAQLEAREGRR
ncbi:MAG: CcmD family protein [Armatimonadota bacterium]|nr:CcmD family protein [Armatimonadota bacterium]MDR7402249.1 CcmD family protein [Armatimonadota bacterium]MDR7403377.1 CcmD family protein [Armatimonadota bacterium]MDR7437885.1 CcmD family protein [Armatimonadota bacterium]MDR7473301.1 CcmD family protein [Armatimonadota bacterium]